MHDFTPLSYIFIIGAYFLGSIPCGLIVVKILGGSDPRLSGSGNIGATNVGRTSGKAAGILTLIGDALKGAIPVYMATLYAVSPTTIALTAFTAFIGHILPIYLGFKGGKGVATAAGVMAVISPLALVISAGVFAVILAITRYVSLGSILSSIAMIIAVFILNNPIQYVALAAAISIVTTIKHRDNIKRLISGTENKFGRKKQ